MNKSLVWIAAGILLSSTTLLAEEYYDDINILDQNADEVFEFPSKQGGRLDNETPYDDWVSRNIGSDDTKHHEITSTSATCGLSQKELMKEMTEIEFISYLKELEELNPGASWQQLITRMHYFWYSYDDSTKIFGHNLFIDGKENEGWEKVKLPNDRVPKFIRDKNGERIDIAHAYAGVRAMVNRKATEGWIFSLANTHAGDLYQVWNGRRHAVVGNGCSVLPNKVQSWLPICRRYLDPDGESTYENNSLTKDWSYSGKYYPDDQSRGNTIGMLAGELVQRGSERTLSSAFARVLKERIE